MFDLKQIHLSLFVYHVSENQQTEPCLVFFPHTLPAYGATLIEHSLIEAGLLGSVKIDSQVDAAQGK